MTTFVDGYTTVADARGEGLEDAISRVTGLSIPTIRAKLREAHGHTKLCNLFRQWPERVDEIASWTANFGLQHTSDAFDEISAITSVGPRVVKRRLEEAHGKTLVQNVFGNEWPSEAEGPDRARRSDGAEPNGRQRISNRGQSPIDIESDDVSVSTRVFGNKVDDVEAVSRSSMFRRYDLRLAREAAGRIRAP